MNCISGPMASHLASLLIVTMFPAMSLRSIAPPNIPSLLRMSGIVCSNVYLSSLYKSQSYKSCSTVSGTLHDKHNSETYRSSL